MYFKVIHIQKYDEIVEKVWLSFPHGFHPIVEAVSFAYYVSILAVRRI